MCLSLCVRIVLLHISHMQDSPTTERRVILLPHRRPPTLQHWATTTLAYHSHSTPGPYNLQVRHCVTYPGNTFGCVDTANDNECISSRRPITRAEAKRVLEAPLVHAIDLINQLSLEDEIPSESVPTEPDRLEATFRVDSTTTSTNNPSGFEISFEHTT